jgi:hypothetical protein
VVASGHLRKERKKATHLPAFLFFEVFEISRSGFRKYFNGICELLTQRNGQKRDKKIEEKNTGHRKKVFSQLFWQKVFEHGLPLFLVEKPTKTP